MIKLNITRYQDNENFDDELKNYKEGARYGNNMLNNSDFPKREVELQAMEVEITETQFEAIRKAVIEQF